MINKDDEVDDIHTTIKTTTRKYTYDTHICMNLLVLLILIILY